MKKGFVIPKFETVDARKAQVKIEKISVYDYKVKDTKYFPDTENADIYLDYAEKIENGGACRLNYYREYYRNGRKWIENL